MRNTNKKGFTIVELVIVIAVIAILAAVLIPTFSGIINRANQSADQQAVTNMNKLLAISTKKPADVDEVVEILVAEGYKGDLSTYFAGYDLAWLASENAIVIVEDDAIVFPEQYVGKTGFELINGVVANNADALTGNLTDGKVVYVGSNIDTEEISVNEAGEYAVNLNGNTVALDNRVQAYANGSLVLSNGVIESENDRCAVYSATGGSVELNNVQVYGASGANTVQCYGGNLVLNNVVAAQHGNNEASWYNSAVQVVNYIELQESGKYKVLAQANATINGGVYTGDKAIQISAPGGNVTIDDGTFTGTTYAINADFAPQNYLDGDKFESVITINGGTLTGNIKISKATELVINGGTFNGSTLTYFDTTANKTVTVELTVDVLAQFVTTGSTIVVNGVSYTK